MNSKPFIFIIVINVIVLLYGVYNIGYKSGIKGCNIGYENEHNKKENK